MSSENFPTYSIPIVVRHSLESGSIWSQIKELIERAYPTAIAMVNRRILHNLVDVRPPKNVSYIQEVGGYDYTFWIISVAEAEKLAHNSHDLSFLRGLSATWLGSRDSK